MNVSTEEIKAIRPGDIKLFLCEDGSKIRSARSLVSIVKEAGMPDGIVDYETRKFELDGDLKIFAIRAMRPDDAPCLNK